MKLPARFEELMHEARRSTPPDVDLQARVLATLYRGAWAREPVVDRPTCVVAGVSLTAAVLCASLAVSAWDLFEGSWSAYYLTLWGG
jgi:hypothetical protein